ncbi:MAG: histidine phosphatase family protein [Comamonadaceae bacterium]|nr:histidine phosphatase family protein [Comamonadaceae bacterium]
MLQGVPGDSRDLARRLTSRGEKQASRMAAWLDRQLPEGARVFSSPAARCEQTVMALGRKFKLRDELLPEGDPLDLLELVQWPLGKSPVVVVGHQPTLGRVIARLLSLTEEDCSVKKGALWWLRHRERGSVSQTVVVTVQTPELL